MKLLKDILLNWKDYTKGLLQRGNEQLIQLDAKVSPDIKQEILAGLLWVLVFLFVYVIFSHSLQQSKKAAPVVQVKDATNTVEVAKELEDKKIPDSANVAAQVTKEIEYIKKHDVAPSYTEPIISQAELPKQEAALVKADKGDVGIAQKQVNTVTKKETGNIDLYSVHLDKEKHGLGVFGGGTVGGDNGSRIEYGVHYRNGKWVYQAGTSNHGGFNGRVAYEAYQW